jgi:Protein of unknown function (DUF742)
VAGPGRGDDRPLPPGPPARAWDNRPGAWEERSGSSSSWSSGSGPSWEGRSGSWDSAASRRGAPQRPSEEEAVGRLVRPYTVTGGRTQPRYQLQIEALVTATVYEPRDLSVLAPECQAILQFCRDWRSVAEISAVLRLPLGVARILIADMGADGLVRIHQREDAEGRPDLNLLERVLSGLRKI